MSDSPTIAVLKNWGKTNPRADSYEYRLALSGVAHFGDLLGDYSKSQLGGYLLEEPFRLWKVGHSYESYPQELAVWLRVPEVSVSKGNIHSSGVPHEEVAENIAALLTVYFRRLVEVIGPASVASSYPLNQDYIPKPWPLPTMLESRRVYSWPRLPLTVIYGSEGAKYSDNNASDVPVSHAKLSGFLSALASHKKADRIVDACRIYHRAMALLFEQTEVSYLMFICAAEAAAKIEVNEEIQTDEQLLSHPLAQSIVRKLEALGHSQSTARETALQLGEPFRKKRLSDGELFSSFLTEYGKGHAQLAPIFNTGILDIFDGDRAITDEDAIEKAYRARSGFVHTAKSFAAASLIGTQPTIPYQAHIDLLIGDQPAPPIIWLERIVSHSLKRYIASSLAHDEQPAPVPST